MVLQISSNPFICHWFACMGCQTHVSNIATGNGAETVFLAEPLCENNLPNRAAGWTDLLLVPCRPADKSKRLMCHGTRPGPNFVYHRPFYGLHCHANTRLYCLAQGSRAGRILSRCRLLHGHRRISPESAFPSTCWDPKLIPFVGALFVHRPGCLVVAMKTCK